MPDIRPTTDLRNKWPAMEAQLSEVGAPIFLTSHGRGIAVLLSNEQYEALCAGQAKNKVSAGPASVLPQFLCAVRQNIFRESMEIFACRVGIDFARYCALEGIVDVPTDTEYASLAHGIGINEQLLRFLGNPGDCAASVSQLVMWMMAAVQMYLTCKGPSD